MKDFTITSVLMNDHISCSFLLLDLAERQSVQTVSSGFSRSGAVATWKGSYGVTSVSDIPNICVTVFYTWDFFWFCLTSAETHSHVNRPNCLISLSFHCPTCTILNFLRTWVCFVMIKMPKCNLPYSVSLINEMNALL